VDGPYRVGILRRLIKKGREEGSGVESDQVKKDFLLTFSV
jgi:hypothetical protein